ncbi:hypothetical protein BpHYR1_014771 [Brachionus plicatilis]|uniref:Uncharacterized protein n=1 Tax=Brachionus plicatilis TaxID=10195 RepID=A0A3M7RVU7_BRAPC|nr:hypothetical protein BpHYR1_014771 [Brachionus plicatilis]
MSEVSSTSVLLSVNNQENQLDNTDNDKKKARSALERNSIVPINRQIDNLNQHQVPQEVAIWYCEFQVQNEQKILHFMVKRCNREEFLFILYLNLTIPLIKFVFLVIDTRKGRVEERNSRGKEKLRKGKERVEEDSRNKMLTMVIRYMDFTKFYLFYDMD